MMILVIGKPCSGKTTLCKVLADEYDFQHIKMGDVFKDYCKKFDKVCDSETSKELKKCCPNYLADHAIKNFIISPRVVIDDVNTESEVEKFKSYGDRLITIEVSAPFIDRFERAIERNRGDIESKLDLVLRDQEHAVEPIPERFIDLQMRNHRPLLKNWKHECRYRFSDLFAKGNKNERN